MMARKSDTSSVKNIGVASNDGLYNVLPVVLGLLVRYFNWELHDFYTDIDVMKR